MNRRVPLALVPALALILAACQPAPAADPEPTGDDHGAIAGATELAEPALHLTTVDPSGAVRHLDLLDETTEDLGEIAPPTSLETDGRFLYTGRDGGVTIVDSGVWTWNHVDHFHYYEAPAALLGDLPGQGAPTVVASDLGAGVWFDGGEAVLLDLDALKDGRIEEFFRLDTGRGPGMVVPLPTGALVTDGGGLRHVDAAGATQQEIPCDDPAGSIATYIGVVVGCADGAVLAATDADGTTFEQIPYPDGTTDRALSFAAREGRPTVAGFTGGDVFWLLDTRERAWSRVELGEPLARVTAVDDADQHVIALTLAGEVLVIDGETGEILARTEPLVSASLADPDLAAGLTLQIDANRAYLNAPAETALFEIDYADSARIARTFDTTDAPAFFAETGR